MDFNMLPMDIQIEILKYTPNFRRLNKTFHRDGLHLFNQFYLTLPFSMNEFINDYFYNNQYDPVMIYTLDAIDLNFYVIYKYNPNQYFLSRYELVYSNGFSPYFYISNMILKKYDQKVDTNQLCDILHRLEHYHFDIIKTKTLWHRRGVCKHDIVLTPYTNDLEQFLSELIHYFNLTFADSVLTSENYDIRLDLRMSFTQCKAVQAEKFNECITYYKKLNADLQQKVKTYLQQK